MCSKVPDRYGCTLRGPVLSDRVRQIGIDAIPRNLGKLTHACRGEESKRVPYHVPSVTHRVAREAPSRQLLAVLVKLMLPRRRGMCASTATPVLTAAEGWR